MARMSHIEAMHTKADKTVDEAIEKAYAAIRSALAAPGVAELLQQNPELKLTKVLLGKDFTKNAVAAHFEVKLQAPEA